MSGYVLHVSARSHYGHHAWAFRLSGPGLLRQGAGVCSARLTDAQHQAALEGVALVPAGSELLVIADLTEAHLHAGLDVNPALRALGAARALTLQVRAAALPDPVIQGVRSLALSTARLCEAPLPTRPCTAPVAGQVRLTVTGSAPAFVVTAGEGAGAETFACEAQDASFALVRTAKDLLRRTARQGKLHLHLSGCALKARQRGALGRLAGQRQITLSFSHDDGVRPDTGIPGALTKDDRERENHNSA